MSRPRHKDGAVKGAGRCPICARPRDEKYKPFCSKRCADIDLARWLGGRYAIPGEAAKDAPDPDAPLRDDGGE